MITVVINGQNYYYPEVGDTDWGSIATLAFDAITKTTLQPVKDLNDPTAVNDFTLYNDIDFGPTHGLRVLFIQSRSNNPAASGVFRLAKDELVAWRNEDNDGDNTISFDSDGDLIVNGVKVTLHGQIVNDDIAAAAGIEESKLALDYSTDSLHTAIENHVTDTNNPHSVTKAQILTGDLIVNSDVDSSAAIDESKLNLDYSTDSLNTAITTHVADTNNPHSVTKAQVLTGDLIVNADVDASAAIVESKLALDYSTSSLNTAITTHTGNTSNPHSTTVANLTDTTITSAANGDVLSYDGSKWINTPSTSSSLSGLSDTAITTPADGDVLVYDSVSTKWENSDQLSTLDSTVTTHVGSTSNPHSTSVSNLTDTSLSGLNAGDVLVYDGVSEWNNQLNELSNIVDTGIISPANGDALVYDGNLWINRENSVYNLTDTVINSSTNGDILVYDSNDNVWNNSDSLSTHLASTSNPHSTSVSNLTDTTITSATSGDVLVHNGSGWINQANSLDNLTNTTITTPTTGEVLTYTGSGWENAGPSAGPLSNITDVTLTSPADKDLLQYDYANSIWVNSSDVWNRIEVNDIANINTATTSITLTASDKRHQIFTATDGFNITLPSTGIKAGEKFVFDWQNDFGVSITNPFIFYSSDNTAMEYAWIDNFTYTYTALADNPASPSDWYFSYALRVPYYRSGSEDHSFTSVSSVAYYSGALYGIKAGVYDVHTSFYCSATTIQKNGFQYGVRDSSNTQHALFQLSDLQNYTDDALDQMGTYAYQSGSYVVDFTYSVVNMLKPWVKSGIVCMKYKVGYVDYVCDSGFKVAESGTFGAFISHRLLYPITDNSVIV